MSGSQQALDQMVESLVMGGRIALLGIPPGKSPVDWSRIVFEAAMTDDGYLSFLGTRHQAMVHIAMHDALNAIRPSYEQYAYVGRSPGADPVAAAAASSGPWGGVSGCPSS